MSWQGEMTQGLVLYRTFPSRCCGFEAMEAERTIVRKQAFPDVTLRSGGECRATSGRSACPNDMGSNAPLACNVWMRKRKRTNWWKFFLKRKILALRRRKKNNQRGYDVEAQKPDSVGSLMAYQGRMSLRAALTGRKRKKDMC